MLIPKKFLTFLVIICVVLVGVSLSFNLILQSATVQAQIHQKAEKMLGMPITMGKLSFHLFTGLHLSHLVITDASQRSLEATSIDFMPTWKTLLSGHWTHLEKWGGILHVKKVTLNHAFSFSNFKAHLRKRATDFLVDPFSSQMADGKLQGAFLLQEENAHSPYQLNLHFSELSLKELIKGASAVEGKVQGTFFMKGSLEDFAKKEGEGTLEVVGMQFKPTGPLAQIGQLLGIEELQFLKFNKAIATYALNPRQFVVKSFKLDSRNLMIHGQGALSYEGALRMSALLLINQNIQARLQGLLPPTMLVPSPEAGFVAIPFNINGSLEHPHSTLLEHIPLPAMNSNVQGIIRQILKF